MGQLQTSSTYFLVCGGVATYPCKCFQQNRIEPKCPYLGLPPSTNSRKICPRFCQNLHGRLSNICDENKTAYFNLTHLSWSNLAHFIVLVPNFPVFRKKKAFSINKVKSQPRNQLWLNMENHSRCQMSLTTLHVVFMPIVPVFQGQAEGMRPM